MLKYCLFPELSLERLNKTRLTCTYKAGNLRKPVFHCKQHQKGARYSTQKNQLVNSCHYKQPRVVVI